MLAASTGTGQWQLRRRDAVAVIAGGVVAVIIDDVPGQWRLRPGVVVVGGGGGNVEEEKRKEEERERTAS